jgi:serine/threonine-protein kinase
MQSLVGKLLDRRYQIVSALARGGFGQTYIAEDTRRPGNPRCVLKHLKPASTDPMLLENARRLFTREAETLEVLGHHKQIPQLLAYFEEEEEFYLVQELIDGKTLSEELSTGGHWSEERVCRMLREVLTVLEFVHAHGVIHRDIKPDNLIRRQSDQKLVLVDFGTVKQARSILPVQDHTFATISVGTPGYMPTEQSHGRPRPNSDLYALGIIAIQALTGLNPKQLQDEPDTGELIWQPWAWCSDELIAILSKMVRYHFKDRYQSATEALEELNLLIGNPEPAPAFAPASASDVHLTSAASTSTLNSVTTSFLSPESPPKESSPAVDLPTLLVPSIVSPEYLTLAGVTASTATMIEAIQDSERLPTPKETPVPVAVKAISRNSRNSEVAQVTMVATAAALTVPSAPSRLIPASVPQCNTDRVAAMRSDRFQGFWRWGAVGLLGVIAFSPLLQRQQAYHHALKDLKQAISLKTSGQFSQCFQQAQAFSADFTDLQQQADALSGDCLLRHAETLAAAGQLPEAIALTTHLAPTHVNFDRARKLASQWSKTALEQASAQYRLGQFDRAIAIATAIPKTSPIAPQIQHTVQQWQQEVQQNQALLTRARQNLDNKRWQDAIATAQQVRLLQTVVPETNPYWQIQVQPILLQAERAIAATRAVSAQRVVRSRPSSQPIIRHIAAQSTPAPAPVRRSAQETSPAPAAPAWTVEQR